MEGRRYSEGLHQALEAKEHVQVREENQTLATITLQNYFRLYDKLSGMTGTAMTEDAEFRQIYKLPVVAIPPNKQVKRIDEDDLIYRTVDAKFHAVADDVAVRHQAGQPCLIGTVSIESSEKLSRLLDKRGIKHETVSYTHLACLGWSSRKPASAPGASKRRLPPWSASASTILGPTVVRCASASWAARSTPSISGTWPRPSRRARPTGWTPSCSCRPASPCSRRTAPVSYTHLENVGRGKDDTLFALCDGKIEFTKGAKHKVHVRPEA